MKTEALTIMFTAWSIKVVEKLVPVIVKRVPPKTEPEVGEIPVMVDEVWKLIPVVSSLPYAEGDVDFTPNV